MATNSTNGLYISTNNPVLSLNEGRQNVVFILITNNQTLIGNSIQILLNYIKILCKQLTIFEVINMRHFLILIRNQLIMRLLIRK